VVDIQNQSDSRSYYLHGPKKGKERKNREPKLLLKNVGMRKAKQTNGLDQKTQGLPPQASLDFIWNVDFVTRIATHKAKILTSKKPILEVMALALSRIRLN
jgi:hypothetical protein